MSELTMNLIKWGDQDPEKQAPQDPFLVRHDAYSFDFRTVRNNVSSVVWNGH